MENNKIIEVKEYDDNNGIIISHLMSTLEDKQEAYKHCLLREIILIESKTSCNERHFSTSQQRSVPTNENSRSKTSRETQSNELTHFSNKKKWKYKGKRVRKWKQ